MNVRDRIKLRTKQIENGDKSPETRYDRARAYVEVWDEGPERILLNYALQDLHRALEKNKDPNYFRLRSRIYVFQARLDDAEEDMNSALELLEHPILFDARATIRRRRGNYEGALEDNNKAIEADQDQWIYTNNKGLVLILMGRHDEAVVLLEGVEEKVLSAGYEGIAYFVTRGRAYLNVGRGDKASEDATKVLGVSDSIAANALLGGAQRMLARTDNARRFYGTALQWMDLRDKKTMGDYYWAIRAELGLKELDRESDTIYLHEAGRKRILEQHEINAILRETY